MARPLNPNLPNETARERHAREQLEHQQRTAPTDEKLLAVDLTTPASSPSDGALGDVPPPRIDRGERRAKKPTKKPAKKKAAR